MVNGLQDFQLGQVITAIGGLGTAAFGLVDAAKSAFSGINRVGLKHIHEVVSELAPEGASAGGPVNALPQANILESLEANWVNGNDLASQKAIAPEFGQRIDCRGQGQRRSSRADRGCIQP